MNKFQSTKSIKNVKYSHCPRATSECFAKKLDEQFSSVCVCKVPYSMHYDKITSSRRDLDTLSELAVY